MPYWSILTLKSEKTNFWLKPWPCAFNSAHCRTRRVTRPITETINHETVYHGNDVRRFDSRYFSKKPRFGFLDQEIFEPSVWLLNYVSKWLPTIPNRARLYFPLRVTLLQSKDLHFIQVMLMHWFFSRKTWSCNKLNILRMLNSVRN